MFLSYLCTLEGDETPVPFSPMRMPRRARGISKSKMADDEEAVKDSTVSPEIIPVDVTRGAIFLAGVTLASVVGGFGLSLGIARRRSPDAFSKSQNEAAKLAMKALGWGTLLAVSGVGLLVLGVKTAMGVKDVSACR